MFHVKHLASGFGYLTSTCFAYILNAGMEAALIRREDNNDCRLPAEAGPGPGWTAEKGRERLQIPCRNRLAVQFTLWITADL